MEKTQSRPNDFDWVNRLSDCQIATVWADLKNGIQGDVDARNATLKTLKVPYGFESIVDGDRIEVVLFGNGTPARSVKFVRRETGIEVFKNDKPAFSASLTLDDDGICRFKIEGHEKTFWQMRKMALEELLFQNPWR